MKKLNFKNCIAFTLTEMTLVLLITSVIAAASTPIITSAISDSAKKNGPSSTKVADAPWKISSSYDGGGIYNSPYTSSSFLSIGHRPGTFASDYKNPSLLVKALSERNFKNNSQITISPSGLTNKTFYSNIAMDEFENVVFTYGNSFASAATNTIPFGYGNVFMGSYIQSSTLWSRMYYDNSIFIGNKINTNPAVNSIYIGYNLLNRLPSDQSGIHIGSNQTYSTTKSGSATHDNIHIGNHTGSNSYGNYNTYIGYYAGYNATTLKNVMIGAYAGYQFGTNLSYEQNYSNVVIGQYAGYTNPVFPATYATGLWENVIIGKYAGTAIKIGSGTLRNENSMYSNIMIGEYSGYYDYQTRPRLSNHNIMIGYYAGAGVSRDSQNAKIIDDNNIFIGNRAGYNTAKLYGNVIIGDEAGMNLSNLTNCVLIGNATGVRPGTTVDGTGEDNILIGAYAGYGINSQSDNNVYIGYGAGKDASSDNDLKMGIGYDTCNSLVKREHKICIGSGTFGMNNDAWHPLTEGGNNDYEMIIGFIHRASDQQSINLFASRVYKYGEANLINVSDKRLKTNIVPSKHSLQDIRKVNIYNFNMKDDINKTPRIGIIAQEYRKLFPHDVVRNPYTKKLAASANWLIYTMVNAIKDLDKNIIALQKDYESYVSDFSCLEVKVNELEKQANQIRKENTQIREHLAKINAKLK